MKKYFAFTALISVLFYNCFAQTVTRGPYLQSLTPTSIKIKWRTSAATDSRVNCGTDSLNLTLIEDVAGNVTDHTVKISNLQPYTTYYYSIGTTSQVLSGPNALHRFKTAPVAGAVQPYRFWAIGDFGKANQQQIDVRNSYTNYTGTTHTDMWLWLGDNAYTSGTDAQFQTEVFDIYPDIMKYMPFYPCPGNHDYESVCAIPCFTNPTTHTGPYFDIIDVPVNGEAGGVPSGRELYYSFDYGNVHFISLNSELGSLTGSYDWNGVFSASNFNNSPVRQWLIDDLTATTKTWVVVYFHQLPYSKGSHDSDSPIEIYMKAMRENYNPIFEQYGVDIVLCGHSHVYERSYLLKGHYGLSNTLTSANKINGNSGKVSLGEPYFKFTDGSSVNVGTVYVVEGNSGSDENGAALNHPAMYAGDDDNGSFIMDVNGMRFDGKYLRRDGTIKDDFTIFKTPLVVSSEVNVAICNGDSYFAGGANQIASGTYYDTIDVADNTLNGSDTIKTTILTVNPPVPVITQQINVLSVPATYASFQWYKDNAQLPGEELPTLQATENGDYFALVSDANGCSTFSDTVSVVIIGINDPKAVGVNLLPNPVTEDVLIIFSKVVIEDLYLDVYNPLGKKVISSHIPSFNGDRETIVMGNLDPGLYLIRILAKSVVFNGRIVKQ